ncbi:MAG TPA: nitrous oxide reductase family maturation protein NosD [Thermoanaerobaculia bacterium]|nr:nitrous oxide reductase family maturation protein NosD [Thermoanaerobaculia bacterium]
MRKAAALCLAAAAYAGLVAAPPAAAEVWRLQARVEAASPGSTVEVPKGTYEGDLVIDRPLRLVGRGRPLLRGSGRESVVRIRANGVTFEGFDIDGRGGGDLGRDTSGIHVAAENAVIRDCRIAGTLFGIYLHQADGAVVERCDIRGIAGKEPGEKGSGIHVFATDGFRLTSNQIRDVRDGLYIQSSPNGVITGNTARDLRYGVHYMFADDNRFEDNLFENSAAGAALMYSRRIVFRRNRFLHNRGFASVGLLLKACDDVTAESNLIADNARGIFLEGSSRNIFRGNVVAESDAAVVLYDSCSATRFEGNSFVENLTPLEFVGRRTDTRFDGNYWSGNDVPDLDGDGISDRAYGLSSAFDHLRGNLAAADLFTRGLSAAALAAAERAFPVLDPSSVEDRAPLARPPALPQVPRSRRDAGKANGPGMALSAAVAAAGVLTLRRGRR